MFEKPTRHIDIDGEGIIPSPSFHFILASRLLKSPLLKGWERLFIATLHKSPNPGRKQLQKLEAIATRLGYAKFEEGGEE